MPGTVEGVGKAPTVRAFEALVREESPDIVFLAEAKVKIARLILWDSIVWRLLEKQVGYSYVLETRGEIGGGVFK